MKMCFFAQNLINQITQNVQKSMEKNPRIHTFFNLISPTLHMRSIFYKGSMQIYVFMFMYALNQERYFNLIDPSE